jgi:cob(I)alamin adenosyltransferase
MTKFYTKTGDDGYTSQLGKDRVAKYDPRIETIGAIDEANAAIAVARTLCLSSESHAILLHVQKDLYQLMSEVSAPPENAQQFRHINADEVSWLEKQLDKISLQVNIPKEFIIPGDSKAGAAIDLARTIVRRAERHLAYLYHHKKIENANLLHYLNRLSSLCFVLELLENQTSGSLKPSLAKE